MKVARSDRLGNLRASMRGTGSSQIPRSFLYGRVSVSWFVYSCIRLARVHYYLLTLNTQTKMKIKCVLSCIALSFVLLSCNNGQKRLSEQLQAQVDSLRIANDSIMEHQKNVSEFLDAITESLDSITEQEQFIRMGSKGMEGKSPSRAEMRQRLKDFAELLERQRNRIAELEDSLTNRGESFERLSSIVKYLNQQIDEKNKNIAALQKELSQGRLQIKALSTKVEELTTTNDSLANTVKQQGVALVVQNEVINEGYYIIGTKSELKKLGILTGGLLARKKLDPSSFVNAGFTKVDISQFLDISINSKTVKILTDMPTNSYTITSDGERSRLMITDPTNFWRVSNYLVIQIK